MTAFPATATDRPLQLVVSVHAPGNHAPDSVLAAETYTLGNLVERGLAVPQPGEADWIGLPNYPADPGAQKALVALLLDMASSLAAKTGQAQVVNARRAVEMFTWQQEGVQDRTWAQLRADLLNEMIASGRFATGPAVANLELIPENKLGEAGLVGQIYGDGVIATLTIPVL